MVAEHCGNSQVSPELWELSCVWSSVSGEIRKLEPLHPHPYQTRLRRLKYWAFSLQKPILLARVPVEGQQTMLFFLLQNNDDIFQGIWQVIPVLQSHW